MPSEYLTRIPGQPTLNQVVPGMAHFAGTGPEGAKCGKCEWFKPAKAAHKGRCEKYFRLMNHDGELIDTNYDACRYFELKVDKPAPLFDR